MIAHFFSQDKADVCFYANYPTFVHSLLALSIVKNYRQVFENSIFL